MLIASWPSEVRFSEVATGFYSNPQPRRFDSRRCQTRTTSAEF